MICSEETNKAMDSLCNALNGLQDVEVYYYRQKGSVDFNFCVNRPIYNQSFLVDVGVTTFCGIARLKSALSHGQNKNDIKCKMEITEAHWDRLVISITSPDMYNLNPKSFESNIYKLSDGIKSYIKSHINGKEAKQ